MSWKEVTDALRHHRVDVLKMDVEGFEFDVLSELKEHGNLPAQISVEFHFFPATYQGPDHRMTILFIHLAHLGYAAFSKELNMLCECCCEFSFLNVHDKPFAVRHKSIFRGL